MFKNVKYYAGLLDSDGSITLHVHKTSRNTFFCYPKITFSQITHRNFIFKSFCDYYSVEICETSRFDKRTGKTYESSSVSLTGTKARSFLNEVKQHLVIKKDLAEFLLSISGEEVSQEVLNEYRSNIKILRDSKTLSDKNFPSRKWMAGYIDGDGHIGSSFRKRDGNLSFSITITSNINDPQGIYLINRVFGGYIVTSENTLRLIVPLTNITKAEEFITYFNSHLILKKPQFDFVLSVLRKGEHRIRKGATYESNLAIHKKLQELKKPQRLSDKPAEAEAIV